MTFKHKLSKRLAISRLALVAVFLAVGCKGSPTGVGDPALGATILRISPRSASIGIRDSVTFSAYLVTGSDSTLADVTWSTTSGSITAASMDGNGNGTDGNGKGSGQGRYKPRANGKHQVVATQDTLTDTVTVTVSGPSVATVRVLPESSIVFVGNAMRLTAELRDSAGGLLSGRTVMWQSSDPAIVAVDDSGQVSAVREGTATITATSEDSVGRAAIAVASQDPTAAADPASLPAATGQLGSLGAYVGRTMAAGETYTDPTTGVLVLKVTDGGTPFAGNARGMPDYSEGGPYISQPWDSAGVTYYTLYVMVGANPSTHYFVDVRYHDLALLNWRQLPTMSNTDIRWAWSLNPTTPRVGFGVGMPSTSDLRKFDTGAMAELTGGGFPKTLPEGVAWLQNSVNDAWFVSSSTSTVYAFSPLTNVLHAWSIPGLDEPHIDRSGAYVYVLVGGASEAPNCSYAANPVIRIFRTADGSEFQPAPNVGAWPDGCRNELWNSHPAGLTGRVAASNPHASYNTPGRYEYAYDPAADVATFHHTDSETFKSSHHRAGQWVFGNATAASQWYVVSNWGTPSGQTQGLRDAIGFISLDSSQPVRLLAHHYSSVTSNYYSQPHATASPDGKLVFWGSTMGVSDGRVDAFVARTPVR